MSRTYYIYWYRLDNEDFYLIWFSNEEDGVVIDENGFVPSFSDKNDLKIYAHKIQIEVDVGNPNPTDFDVVQIWLENGGKIKDYKTFLDVWNLLADISVSTKGDFDNKKEVTNDIYDRIFWGCNIPVVTPEGKSFTPTWTKKELKIIRETLNYGFQMFNKKINQQ